MKKMTCKQMGGPCDETFEASSAEEMLKKGTEHLMAMKDDPAHLAANKMMQDMMQNPEAGQKWNAEFAAKFAELPEENV